MSSAAGRFRPAYLVGAALGAVSVAYLFAPVMVLEPGGLLSALRFRGFYGAEPGFRWSGERGVIRIPDPGPGRRVGVEIDLSAWRPPGTPLPDVRLSAGSATAVFPGTRRFETRTLETATRGIWSSDLEVEVRVPTFEAGAHDARPLGARVGELRLVPRDGLLGLRRPPLRVVAAGAAAALLLFALLRALGSPGALAFRIALAAALSLAPGLILARAIVASAVAPATLGLAALTLLARLFPRAATALSAAALSAARAGGGAARTLASPLGAGLAGAGLVAVAVAQLATPQLSVDVGSGRTAGRVRGFGALDSAGGRSFRNALRGGELDLRDLGIGGEWRIVLDAAVASGPRELTVARAGDVDARGVVGATWTQVAMTARALPSWRGGLRLAFPDAHQHVGLRIAQVRIDRGASLPSPRVAVCCALGLLLAAAIPLALGGSRLSAGLTGLVAAAAVGAGLTWEPLAAASFAPGFLGVAAASALGACLAAGAHVRWGASRGLPLTALIGPALGFLAWWLSTTFPLYRGGHFTFHSSIAQEIWGGHFWTYYLPYPGSMLSRQLQWGNLIFPHPCLFHVVAAPLAALGQPWFHALEKALLAGWLALIAACAAALAGRSGGPRAAVYAGALTPLVPLTYQLLGLGHLMTLFGACTTSLALTYLVHRLGDLTRRRAFVTGAGLVALALLSYFAAVPFAVVVFGLALPFAFRRSRSTGWALMGVGLTGAALAFGLYYVNWTLPFLTESVPALLSGSDRGTGAAALSSRLLLQPGKLSYTFGSWLVPLVALLCLARMTRREDRLLLWPWAGLLPAFGALDLFFNFLLKHHYFTLAPVAVGLALGLSHLHGTGRTGRAAALVAVLALGALAVRAFLATALGWIP